MEIVMNESKAKLHIKIIGIYYIISGIWEYLSGLMQAESIPPRIYFILDIYRNYLTYLGLITILMGIIILFKVNFARLAVICLAWWNLFTSPLLDIWWVIYAVDIKKFLVRDHSISSFLYSFFLTIILVAIRIYIIYILRISKAGYIFLKENKT